MFYRIIEIITLQKKWQCRLLERCGDDAYKVYIAAKRIKGIVPAQCLHVVVPLPRNTDSAPSREDPLFQNPQEFTQAAVRLHVNAPVF